MAKDLHLDFGRATLCLYLTDSANADSRSAACSDLNAWCRTLTYSSVAGSHASAAYPRGAVSQSAYTIRGPLHGVFGPLSHGLAGRQEGRL